MQKALKDGGRGAPCRGLAQGEQIHNGCVSQGTGHAGREVAASTRTLHSLWPGTPGGDSVLATGSLLLPRQRERHSDLRRATPAMPPRRICGRGVRGQEIS